MPAAIRQTMTDSGDRQAMAEALRLARRGLFTTTPNPRVGCVITRGGQVIGRGWHRRAGEPHAEIHALRDAGDARGATVYVTLEPCRHQGRTGPCCEALIEAGVARVVAAMRDPNPAVAGGGLERLAAAGIDTACGLLEEQARALNPGFVQRMERGRPWLRLKLAASLDGRTAMASGESQWITGPAARADVQRLRARSCAVLTGVDSLLADDSRLTVRDCDIGRQPLRVVLDSSLRTPPGAALLRAPGAVLVVGARQDAQRAAALRAAGAEVLILPGDDGRVNLPGLMVELARRGCNEVLAETGATLAGGLWRADLVDELVLYWAPTLLGSEARPLLALPFTTMAQQQRLRVVSMTAVGEDWRLIARPDTQPETTQLETTQLETMARPGAKEG